jgi:phosphatidylglycerol:prolipoprotein diacylglycerol transferase
LHPILIEWGPILLPAWHALFAAGAIAGYLCFAKLADLTEVPISPADASQFFLINYIFGYFGARLASIIIEQRQLIHNASDLIAQLFTLGPMTFYGGLMGGLGISAIWIVIKGFSSRALVDASIPSLMLGLSFGRIGCFLNGDDFGKPVSPVSSIEPWWSVKFPNLADNVARYPVQLIEAFVAFALCIAGAQLLKLKILNPGFRGLLVLAVYAFSRFFIEYLRGDPRGWVIEGLLSPSQFISLILMGTCIVIAWKWQSMDPPTRSNPLN